jgi:mannose-6-phosphate isomerase-like protein (cupin superfamily)
MDAVKDRYDIDTGDIMFALGEAFDVVQVAAAQTPWWNRTLCAVNDAWVRLGVMEGDFHWHKHDREDEFFYVTEGKLLLDLEGRTVELAPGQGLLVPRGVMHRTRAPSRTVVLMIEAATVVPTGD